MKTEFLFSLLLLGLLYHVSSCNVSSHSSLNNLGNTTKIYYQGEVFKERIDLWDDEATIFGYSAGRIKASELVFVDCVFEKPVLAYANGSSDQEKLSQFYGNVSFINCEFRDTVNFKGSAFHAKVNMVNSVFLSDVNFQDAIFMQQSNFYKAQFSRGLAFQNARFYHRTSFMEITAADNTSFQSAVFHDDVNFSVSKAYAYMDFSLCRFYGRATFNYLKWEGKSVFNNSTFFMPAQFIKSEIAELKMDEIDKRSSFDMVDSQ